MTVGPEHFLPTLGNARRRGRVDILQVSTSDWLAGLESQCRAEIRKAFFLAGTSAGRYGVNREYRKLIRYLVKAVPPSRVRPTLQSQGARTSANAVRLVAGDSEQRGEPVLQHLPIRPTNPGTIP